MGLYDNQSTSILAAFLDRFLKESDVDYSQIAFSKKEYANVGFRPEKWGKELGEGGL